MDITNKKRVYTILLNSDNKVSGSTNSDAVYNFKWNALEDNRRYAVSFAYKGEINNNFSRQNPLLACNLGQYNSFTTSATASNAMPTTILGQLMFDVGNTWSNLYANHLDNPPIIIDSLPQSNTLSVSILNKSLQPYTDDGFSTGLTVSTIAANQVITVAGTRTSGYALRIGSILTITGIVTPLVIQSQLSGTTGGAGTYMVSTPVTTTVTNAALTTSNQPPADYLLTLRFESVD